MSEQETINYTRVLKGESSFPTISVLLPVKNGAKYIRETLDTVSKQTFKDWELVIMDGDSTDGTLEIIKEWASGKRVNVRVYSEPDENGFHAITRAFEVSRGSLIFMLCASDGYLNSRWFEKCVKAMSDPEISLVWGIPFQMTEEGKMIGANFQYAHFLPKFNPLPVIVHLLKKVFSKGFLSKVNSANLNSARNIIRRQKIPQKADWIAYWRKTGTMFPDGNMCVRREIFDKYFPKYQVGSKDPGDFTHFNRRFNEDGLLAHGIPEPANYGRTHRKQVGEVVKEYNDQKTKEYLRKIPLDKQ